MDLREYARNIEKELSGIEKEHEVDCIFLRKKKISIQLFISKFTPNP